MSRKIPLELNASVPGQGIAIGNKFLRFLPSFVVFAVLLVALVLADWAQVRAVTNQRRHAAEVMLRDVHVLIDRHVHETLRSARDLASRIDPSFDIEQDAFAALIRKTMSGSAQLIRAELAPGFVTKMVYPQDGNQGYIGKSLLPNSFNPSADIEGNLPRRASGLTMFHLTETGLAELQVQRDVWKTEGATIVSTGMVQLVVQFELTVAEPSEGQLLGDVDFLILSRADGAPPPKVSPEWQVEGNFEPHTTIVQYQQGNLFLFLRPVKGWLHSRRIWRNIVCGLSGSAYFCCCLSCSPTGSSSRKIGPMGASRERKTNSKAYSRTCQALR